MPRFLVSKTPNKRNYSGGADERLFKTKEAAKKRVKKVKRISGKQYHISEID